MEKYKGILPDDVLHIITKGKTCELCVQDKNLSNYLKFSDFITDSLVTDINYCYVIHCELYDGGLFVSSGGFKLRNMDEDDKEMIYNHLIHAFLSSYSGNDPVNMVNVSFHPYDIIMMLKDLKSTVGL
jgi:hypothetical protein